MLNILWGICITKVWVLIRVTQTLQYGIGRLLIKDILVLFMIWAQCMKVAWVLRKATVKPSGGIKRQPSEDIPKPRKK